MKKIALCLFAGSYFLMASSAHARGELVVWSPQIADIQEQIAKKQAEDSFLSTYKALHFGGIDTPEASLVRSMMVSPIQKMISALLVPSKVNCPSFEPVVVKDDVAKPPKAEAFIPTPVVINSHEQSFYDRIEAKLALSPFGRDLLAQIKGMKFQFAGFTKSVSKANTDPATRHVKIREDLDIDTASLSLAYEASNVINSSNYLKIFEDAKACRYDAKGYAKAVLKFESEAVLRRSIVAKELGLDSLILNKEYHRIANLKNVPLDEKLGMLRDEMRTNGKVGSLKIPVMEHYEEQFRKTYPQCGLD